MSDTPSPYFTAFVGRKVYDKVLYDEMLEAIAVLSRELSVAIERANKFYRLWKKFDEEWPGGLDEIEACWTNWKEKAESAEARLRDIEAAELPIEPNCVLVLRKRTRPSLSRFEKTGLRYIDELRTFAIRIVAERDDARKQLRDLADTIGAYSTMETPKQIIEMSETIYGKLGGAAKQEGENK